MGHNFLSMLVSVASFSPAAHGLLQAVANLEQAAQAMLREHRAEVRVRHCAYSMAAALNLAEAADLAEALSWPPDGHEASWRRLAQDAFAGCQDAELWDRALRARAAAGRESQSPDLAEGVDLVCTDPELNNLVLGLHREVNLRHPLAPNWRPKWRGRR